MVVRLQTAAQPGAAAQAHQLVRDLHAPDPRIFWIDMLLTALIAWSAFASAIALRPGSLPMLLALSICTLALYRGVCFVHELSHVRAGALGRFEQIWNFVFGMPMLLPSFTYVGVHQYHHSLATYGTEADPEYLPFSGKPLMIAASIIQSLFLPLALLVRFFVLAPLGLIYPGIHRWLCRYASSLCLNPKFRRDVGDAERGVILRREAETIAMWLVAGSVALHFHVALRCLALWYVASACAALVNMLRTLGAHRYASDGTPLEREAQLIDSIDTPGAVWTEIWAPVGLRYHALHHYFPGIPYHNLGKAYRRLVENLPADALYHRATSPGLPHSIDTLRRGGYDPFTG